MSTTDTTPAVAPPKELYRPRDDRFIAGVAGGLGRYFDISTTFFRIAFVILTLVGGAGFLIYVAAALVIPAEGSDDSIAADALKRHRDRPWLLAGVALVAIALISLVVNAHFWPNSDFAWFLLLVGIVAIVVAQRRDRPAATGAAAVAPGEVPPRAPRRPSLFLPGIGLLLAAAGVLAVLAAAGVDIRWDLALGVGAIAVGLAVAAGAMLQRRTGGLLVVGILLAGAALAISAIDVRLEGEVGDRDYHPATAADLPGSYEFAVGDFQIDLTDTALPFGETDIDAELGVGELLILVPSDVAVDVDATASVGDISVFGREDDGFDARVVATDGGVDESKRLHIDAHVGFGELRIVRMDG